MLGFAFQSVAEYLVQLENSSEDWRVAPILAHMQVRRLFPFCLAAMATLEAHGVITMSQFFTTHLSGGINKPVSADLKGQSHEIFRVIL